MTREAFRQSKRSKGKGPAVTAPSPAMKVPAHAAKRLHSLVERFYVGDQDSSDDEERVMDEFARSANEIMGDIDGACKDKAAIEEIKRCFDSCDKLFQTRQNFEENEMIEDFLTDEQCLGRKRRDHAQRLEASEEKRLADDVAEFKVMRLQMQEHDDAADLQRRISEAEKSYMRRKMVVAKASQAARAECRLQFSRVREFFEKLHANRKDVLRRQYKHSLKLQSAVHRFSGTDDRVVSLEKQIASRLYEKKLKDLNELHLALNLEEAVYLESMLDSLEGVQGGKEMAARELFELRVRELKSQKEKSAQRNQAIADLVATSTKEMARMVALYTEEAASQDESDLALDEKVEKAERRKEFNSSPAAPVMSVSRLYDTVLWSVASSQLGLSSTDSSLYGSEYDEELEDDNTHEEAGNGGAFDDSGDFNKTSFCVSDFADDGSACSSNGSAMDGMDDERMQQSRFSFAGDMHLKQLSKDLQAQTRKLKKQHKVEKIQDRKEYRKRVRALKKHHQGIIEGLLRKSLVQRHELRDAVTRRMESLARDQEVATQKLRHDVEKEWLEMKDAMKADNDRIRQTEERSFAKAQTLISAQVFHEVRNALSSVVAMSEMTSSLRDDDTVSPQLLVSSVDDMLDQIKEIVGYSVNMLNNVLDINKINSGAYEMNVQRFDIQDMVARATTMQLAKVSKDVKMVFTPSPEPYIVASDKEIVVRMITNLISNAAKFTTEGSIQPFVCPLEDLLDEGGLEGRLIHLDNGFQGTLNAQESGDLSLALRRAESEGEGTCTTSQESFSVSQSDESRQSRQHFTRQLAVGVVDTGPGLSTDRLNMAKTHIAQSDPGTKVGGVKNSGFGLHLAHQLSKAIGTELRLTSIDACPRVLSDVTRGAMATTKQNATADCGTVLYFTLPCYDTSGEHESIQEYSDCSTVTCCSRPGTPTTSEEHQQYVFDPKPSPTSKDGSFRILVADDVLMLRKGLVNSLLSLFPNCPVSISTACSAEDVLRAVTLQPFDLLICDNEFRLDLSNLKELTDSDIEKHGGCRPCILYDTETDTKESLRHSIKRYFDDERFTLAEDDGLLSGFDAVMQLAMAPTSSHRFPLPLLMLLSGHKLVVPENLGVLFVQKPLKRTEFIPFLESSVDELLAGNNCSVASSGIVSNKHGAQLFRPPGYTQYTP